MTPVHLQELEHAVAGVVFELGAGKPLELESLEDRSTRLDDRGDVRRAHDTWNAETRRREPHFARRASARICPSQRYAL